MYDTVYQITIITQAVGDVSISVDRMVVLQLCFNTIKYFSVVKYLEIPLFIGYTADACRPAWVTMAIYNERHLGTD